MKISKWHESKLPYIFSFLAGAMLVLAFAPMNQFYFAVISPAILYYLLNGQDAKKAALIGWWFGVGQFGVGVSWIYVSIHVYGYTPVYLAAILTALFVATLALFHALQCYGLNYYFPKHSNRKLLLVFPISWVLIEWLRSWLFTGFPWLLMGYSQTSSPLKGYIPIIGQFGIGFLLVFTSALILYVLYKWRCSIRWGLACFAVVFIWTIGAGLSQKQWTQPVAKRISVALVQGNISQSIKWDPKRVRGILRTYYDLTLQHLNSNIIIWPEAAIPLPKRYALPFLKQMDTLAKQHHVSLFTGIPVQVADSFSYYNAMIALGDATGHYYKRHLVPFGEYVPFANLLRGVIGFFSLPMSNMVSGPKYQPDLMSGKISLAPFICYEIAYWEDIYTHASRSNVLVTISDDAWFGNSLAPFQHLQIGQFRAIETGRDLLFASNDGITAIVNDQGNIIKRVPQFIKTVLIGSFQPRAGKTPWLYYGNSPIILMTLLLLFILVIIERRKSS